MSDLFAKVEGGGPMFPPAVFSPCRMWRYTLWRELPIKAMAGVKDNGYLACIGLNPSVADETNDDPTIRRVIGFARDWGHSGLMMLNLFAFRATDPRVMKKAADPVGVDNDAVIARICSGAGMVLAAWGAGGDHRARDKAVCQILRDIKVRPYCLGTTRSGFPRHPLYVPAVTQPVWYYY